MAHVEIGISGWTYKGWRGTFYPPKLAHSKELEFASRELPTIEINGTFYSLQRPSSYQHWYETTPQDFVFSVKANRYITHIKRLKNVEIPLANFFASGVLALNEKLGPILWQFPPSMVFDPEKFETFFTMLPETFKEAAMLARKSELPKERKYTKVHNNYRIRHAIEVRHYSFLNPLFVEMLKHHNIAVVFADTAGKWPYLEDITADFIYVRLHGESELYVSGYDDESLEFWKNRVEQWKKGRMVKDQMNLSDEPVLEIPRDIFIYFDNDAKVRAPLDAKELIHKLEN